jgi:hypothetical protein
MESNAFRLTQTIYVPAGHYLLTIEGTEEDAAATGDLDLTDTVLIIGDGQGETIIDGNDHDSVFHIVGNKRHNSHNLIIVNLTIQSGHASYGGGVLVGSNIPSIVLRYVTMRDNYAYGQHPCGQSAGAALYAGSPAQIGPLSLNPKAAAEVVVRHSTA